MPPKIIRGARLELGTSVLPGAACISRVGGCCQAPFATGLPGRGAAASCAALTGSELRPEMVLDAE